MMQLSPTSTALTISVQIEDDNNGLFCCWG